MPFWILLGFLVLAIAVAVAVARWQAARARAREALLRTRLDFIAHYRFPLVLENRLAEALPTLDRAGRDRVLEHLRAWFLLVATRPGEQLGMPSRAVDTAWHAFILLTREYTAFCERAFGGYLHHTPETGDREAARARLGATLAAARASGPFLVGTAAGALLAADLFTLDRDLGLPGGWTHGDAEIAAYAEAHARRQTDGAGGGDGGVHTDADGGGDGGGGGCGGGCGS